jgi:hypothetical protein
MKELVPGQRRKLQVGSSQPLCFEVKLDRSA